jgi:hypothetical protein
VGSSKGVERMHVLVIDGDETLRGLVRETLTNMRGAKVVEAEDAAGGLRKLEAHPETTLIVCDWDLAGMDAEFVERGRSITPASNAAQQLFSPFARLVWWQHIGAPELHPSDRASRSILNEPRLRTLVGHPYPKPGNIVIEENAVFAI